MGNTTDERKLWTRHSDNDTCAQGGVGNFYAGSDALAWHPI